jgi:hypothetical protein
VDGKALMYGTTSGGGRFNNGLRRYHQTPDPARRNIFESFGSVDEF